MRRRDFLQLGALPLAGPARQRSCILLQLTGGPSHLDTWDMKPDAPREIRGPFRPIRTNVPGIEICEIFPRMAQHAEKYTLVRSVYHDAALTHEAGWQVLRPVLPGPILNNAALLKTGAQGSRRGTGASRADRGSAPPAPFEANCRQAVRLVESGVPFVTVSMFDSVFDEISWDMHGWKPFASFASYRDSVGPLFDRACSSLLEDLSQRGLLETTLVVAAGEFGRTPRINPSGGRDHWAKCWTILMAGGGIRGGQVYGSSDKTGAEPRDNPVSLPRVTATIYSALGIPLPDPAVRPIAELFS